MELSKGNERAIIVTPASLATALRRPAIFTIVWLAALVEVWNVWVKLPEHAGRFDFSIYYLSAVTAREGRNPYTADFRPLGGGRGLEVGEIRHATDPPTFLLLTQPLASMPERVVFEVWSAANLVFLAGALMILLGKSSGLRWSAALTMVPLALIYPPVEIHFFSGQSKIPILLLLAAMLRLMESGRDRAAGLCLAFASLLRIFPLLLIGYLAIQRRWSVLGWTMVGIAAGTLTTLALFGVSNSLSFYNGVYLLAGRHWLTQWGNIALRAAVSRMVWLCAGKNAGAATDAARVALVIAVDAALLLATIKATLRLRAREDPDWRAFTLWIVASLLLSPTAWVHYMVLSFILFAQLVRAAHESRASIRAQWAAILSYAAMVLTTLLPVMVYVMDAHPGDTWTGLVAAAMGEAWFASAILTYLTAYWFTVDSERYADRAAGREKGFGQPREMAVQRH